MMSGRKNKQTETARPKLPQGQTTGERTFVPLNSLVPPVPNRSRLLVWSKADLQEIGSADYTDPGDDVERTDLSILGPRSILRNRRERMVRIETMTGGEYFLRVVRKALTGCVAMDGDTAREEPFLLADQKGLMVCYQNEISEPTIASRGTLVCDYFHAGERVFFVQPRTPADEVEQYRITSSITSLQTVSEMPRWVEELAYPM